MKSSNPIFKESVIEKSYVLPDRAMTIGGTMNKLLLLSVIMLIAAGAVYYQFSLQHFDYVQIMMIAGIFVGLICAFAITFVRKSVPYLAPIYAFSQGAALSALSCMFESLYPGIVIQAISMTFLCVFAMAILYKLNIIKATEKFRSIIFTVTTAICAFYLLAFLLTLFHINIPYFASNSPLSIFVNILIAGVAALNLIIDFDFIENGVTASLPALYEWYGAYGLLVTILWLYIEILRLLARVRQR